MRQYSSAVILAARVVVLTYFVPPSGYIYKLKARFGATARIVLNTETALRLVLKNLPDRSPGKLVFIEKRFEKRFMASIKKSGLKPLVFETQNDLKKILTSTTPHAVIISDAFSSASPRIKKILEKTEMHTIVYQRRKHPRPVEFHHSIYLWEPSQLPKVASGTVVVVDPHYTDVLEAIKRFNATHERMTDIELAREIMKLERGRGSKFGYTNIRPPRVMARLLYTIYK